MSLFPQELTQELKIKPGTNPGTKKSQELTQELNPMPGTKSSSSGTKLRTLCKQTNEDARAFKTKFSPKS